MKKTKQKIFVFNVLRVYVAETEEYATELLKSDLQAGDYNIRLDTINIEAVIPQEQEQDEDEEDGELDDEDRNNFL